MSEEMKTIRIELLVCRQCGTYALSIGGRTLGGCGGPYYIEHAWPTVKLERLIEDLQEVHGEQG